jgi:sterol desaturase/sphingolipid hydroxylase (fatty acid hydroxylase superfamily)
VLALLLLDFVKYATHWTYHSVPFLWRVHQVHHSDPDFDVSTGTRVHPIEVVLTQGVYLGVIAIFAPPVLGVLIAELAGAFQSFFGHANASLPGWMEKPLRVLFVTPDMHRIHHSEEVVEQFRNLGEIFPWWDRLFRTYLAAPAAGQDAMVVGLKGYQNNGSLGVAFMLKQPFVSEKQD